MKRVFTVCGILCLGVLSFVVAAGPKYLIFGENHFDMKRHNMLKAQLAYLKKQGYNTLAVESWKPQQAKSIYGSKVPTNPHYTSSPGAVRLISLSAAARKVGMKITFIDIPYGVYQQNYSGRHPMEPVLMHQRNIHMANQLSKIPGKAVVLTGLAHIGKNSPYGNTVDGLLKQKGYTTSTIGLAVPSKSYLGQATGLSGKFNRYDPVDYGQFYANRNWAVSNSSQLRGYINSSLADYPDPPASKKAYFGGYNAPGSSSSPQQQQQTYATQTQSEQTQPQQAQFAQSPKRRASSPSPAKAKKAGKPRKAARSIVDRLFAVIERNYYKRFPSSRGNIAISVNPWGS